MAAEGRQRAREQPRRRGAEQPPRRGGSDLLTRILVAIPLAVLAIVFIDVGGIVFALFMIAAGWLCLIELYRLLGRWRPLSVLGLLATAGMVLAARYGSLRNILEVMVVTVPVLFLLVLARGEGHATTAFASTLLGIYWIGLAVTHGELLRQLPHGKGVVIDVLLGTFVGDTGAYLGGRLFGRRTLAPRISPHKTWEGLICGMLAAIVAVFLAGTFQTWLTQGEALLLGLAVAVFAPIGDLFESVVKRDAGTKDTGHLFGPHGGVLDRADAALFTMAAGYYVWLAAVQ